jgi:hypothetical protein
MPAAPMTTAPVTAMTDFLGQLRIGSGRLGSDARAGKRRGRRWSRKRERADEGGGREGDFHLHALLLDLK